MLPVCYVAGCENEKPAVWWAVELERPAHGLIIVQWLEPKKNGSDYTLGRKDGIDDYLAGHSTPREFINYKKTGLTWAGPTEADVLAADVHVANVASYLVTQDEHETIKPGHIVIFTRWEDSTGSFEFGVGTVRSCTKFAAELDVARPTKQKQIGRDRLSGKWFRDCKSPTTIEVTTTRVLDTPCKMSNGDNPKNFMLDQKDVGAALEAAVKARTLPENLK